MKNTHRGMSVAYMPLTAHGHHHQSSVAKATRLVQKNHALDISLSNL